MADPDAGVAEAPANENDSWLEGIGVCVANFFSSDPHQGGCSQAPLAPEAPSANGGVTPAPPTTSPAPNQSGSNAAPSADAKASHQTCKPYGPGIKEQYDRGYQDGLSGADSHPGPLANDGLAAYEDGYSQGSSEQKATKDKPQPQEAKQCVEIVHVQKGLTLDPEDANYVIIGETEIDMADLGAHGAMEGSMIAYDIYKFATGAMTIARLAHCAAAIGAGLILAGPYIAVALEHFPEKYPRCTAQCSECEERLQKSGDPGARCMLANRHCDEHRCPNHHSWVD